MEKTEYKSNVKSLVKVRRHKRIHSTSVEGMKILLFVRTSTAAREIDVSPSTIQRMCIEGKISYKKLGNLIMIDREVWEEWKARNIQSV